MKQIRFLNYFLCVAISSLLLGCNKDIAKETGRVVTQEQEVFTLTATYGSADTKIAFDDDGLGLSWVPGDCLYLVDVNGNNSTVKLTTSITEPAKKASFKSESSVLSGNYIVLSGANSLEVSPHTNLEKDVNLKNYVILYGTLSVSDGQTTASISLKHAFAKLKFNFKNFPTGLSGYGLGMAVSSDGISPQKGVIQENGFSIDEGLYSPVFRLGDGAIESGMSSLIAPYDYSGTTVLFYFYGTNSAGNHVTYEIKKQGKNLQAGTNYNIDFDFSKATVSTIYKSGSSYLLKTAADFRAAAYWGTKSWNDYPIGNTYYVDNDVDFTNEIYIPIVCNSLKGENHTLSNITIDYNKCDAIGLFYATNITNLAVNSISVKGRNNVGAISGGSPRDYVNTQIISISKCIARGNNYVIGNDYVGGLIGTHASRVDNCAYEGSVQGNLHVGGITGYDGTIDRCYVKGNISGFGNVGGISPSMRSGAISNSYIIGDVSGSTSSVGGISVNGYPRNCYSYGNFSSTFGITRNLNNLSNITSSSRLSENHSETQYCNYGPSKPFLSGLSYINANEAFSTQVWPNIDAQCPILQWQSDALNGDIDIPGYNDIDW